MLLLDEVIMKFIFEVQKTGLTLEAGITFLTPGLNPPTPGHFSGRLAI
jgi:hypothetical protein